jgi:hypothetical protein
MNETIGIRYDIELPDGTVRSLDIRLDAVTLQNRFDPVNAPEWARRASFGCTHQACALPEEAVCPIAWTIHDLLNRFGDLTSTECAVVTVETKERTIRTRAPVSAALRSIAGILLATCGCPVFRRFTPMARFHLPFATLEETEYRVFSMYALARMFREQKGLGRDDQMQELSRFYQDVQDINRLAARKIAAIQHNDATINGLVALDAFALMVTFSLESGEFPHLERLFSDWLLPET